MVLCSITDQSFGIIKGDIAWCSSVPLIIGNYLHISVLEDTHTRMGGAKINANCRSLRHGCWSAGPGPLEEKTATYRAAAAFNEIVVGDFKYPTLINRQIFQPEN